MFQIPHTFCNNDIIQVELDFSNPALMKTMKAIELSYWDYIDNHGSFSHVRLTSFLQMVMRHNGLSGTELEKAPTYVKMYERYKKSLPTAGIVLYHIDMFVVIRMHGSSIWSMPKGKQEEHEQIVDTARREFLEETGINIDRQSLLNAPLGCVQNIQKTKFYFVETPELQPKFTGYNANEIAEVKWVSITAVRSNARCYSRQTLAVAHQLQDIRRLTEIDTRHTLWYGSRHKGIITASQAAHISDKATTNALLHQ